MKILVFDDNEMHRRSAMAQLKAHDLMVVGTYQEAEKALQEKVFDVFLTDLLVPAPGSRRMPLAGQEMPLGTILAFLALARGVKLVAVITDENHHKHPASAALDSFFFQPVILGETKIVFMNYNVCDEYDPQTGESFDCNSFERRVEKERRYPNGQGLVSGKSWNQAMEGLLKK